MKNDVGYRLKPFRFRATINRKPLWSGRFFAISSENQLVRIPDTHFAAFLESDEKLLRQNETNQA